MERTKNNASLSSQMRTRMVNRKPEKQKEYDGDFGTVISTGSTLLDLAISGGRIRGGGLPGGILVEAFGPSGSGKTVFLSEVAGDVQRKGGDARFDDPESRLNVSFARMFGLVIDGEENYSIPDTVTEVFNNIRSWKPSTSTKDVIHGVFVDSLAALSTKMEMDEDEGDKMGMRRAKEFSEELRKTCRLIKDKNYLMVCSNQVRENIAATKYQTKESTPGGKAMGFYSSLRLQFSSPSKIKLKKTIVGKERERIIGVETLITVYKSSIWKPFRTAPVSILFDYGIDDIQQNLQYIKDYTTNKVYTVGGHSLDKSMEVAVKMVEQHGLENKLKNEVIDLWESVESKFESERKPKVR
jgi:recombination protein RecA